MLAWMKRWFRRASNSTTSKPAAWFIDWLHQERENDSGVSIDGQTGLRYAPVWHAVNRICGRVAQLPLVLYERTGERTKARASRHPAYALMKRRPNPLMTAATFKELLQYHAIMWGNGRAAIVRNRRNDPLELVPLLPTTSKTVLVDGEKWHTTETKLESGEVRTYKFRDLDVLHVAGLGYDGLAGYPLWDLAKNSWGLGLAAQRNQARLFRHQSVPGLILQAPAGVFPNDEEAKKFLQAFRNMHEGFDNAGKTALLREGITANKLSMTNDEAQALEQRAFQREEAALWFALENMLGIKDSVSYNSLEQKQLAELVNCLNPWLVKWSEQCEAKLLREREILADSHFFRWSTGALLRSDTKTTYETLTLGIRGRLITPNEAREVLDLDPIDGGDELQNPAIDVRTPAADSKDTDDSDHKTPPESDTKPDPTQARLAGVIGARLQELVAVERQRVEAAAGKPDAGVRLDDFYGRWQDTLAKAVAPMLPDADPHLAGQIALAWCSQSRALLREQTDTSSWPDRAAKLAEAMLQPTLNLTKD
jgi:HK97 family phage portal protein